jgi:KaiC/GvpD/RAD55 family RecA-like ATPase
MGAILPLPSELSSFLLRPTPQALVVRGPPGTGKTTFALALLQSFRGKRLYVSGRLGREELAKDFPWLIGPADGVTVVDCTRSPDRLEDTLRAIEEARQVRPSQDGAPDLDSTGLPPQVVEAWNRAIPQLPTMIVLDSWDSIVEQQLDRRPSGAASGTARSPVERSLLARIISGPVFAVLVVEDREAGQLEYLVNGVVTLERQSSRDRLERWLILDKLRGVRISSPTYPFTLEGGRFQCASRLDSRQELRLGRADPDPEPERNPGTLWPGSTEYAAHFGRAHLGRLTLIETERDVPDYAVRLLTSSFLTSVLANGGKTFHLLPPRAYPNDIWKMCSGMLSREEFLRLVRVEGTGPLGQDEEIAGAVIEFPQGLPGASEPRTPEALRFLQENPDPRIPNLTVLWSSGLKALNAQTPGAYTPENLPGIVQAYLHRARIHTLFIGRDDDPLTDSLAPMAEARVHMMARSGRVFVWGGDPPSPYMVLAEGDDLTPYRLLVVV